MHPPEKRPIQKWIRGFESLTYLEAPRILVLALFLFWFLRTSGSISSAVNRSYSRIIWRLVFGKQLQKPHSLERTFLLVFPAAFSWVPLVHILALENGPLPNGAPLNTTNPPPEDSDSPSLIRKRVATNSGRTSDSWPHNLEMRP